MTATYGIGVLPPEVAQRYPHGYAVLDIETSGLNARYDRVLQIAVTQMRADGAIERTWSTLLDPGVDPGLVEVHGLTPERLAGSPGFPDVAGTVCELVDGRLLVAHNARFDWEFLASEADRSRTRLPVESRLCTIALTRRLDLPVLGMSLDVVSAYWGVQRVNAHDAVDDTRVLVEVLRHSLVVAHRINATLPLTPCTATAHRPVPTAAPRTRCAWKYPGRWSSGQPVVQGMKVAFTGDTTRPRDLLIREASAAGIDVMNNVSSRTSLLVRNPTAPTTRKYDAALSHGTPTVDERAWGDLISHIAPGASKTAASTTVRPASTSARATPPSGPLAKCRVIVLGGTHDQAAAMRDRIIAAGGQAAANLTASVTHLMLLDGGDTDPRYARASALERLDPDTLLPAAQAAFDPATDVSAPTDEVPEPAVLTRGAVLDLPTVIDGWSLSVSWLDNPSHPVELDVVAFVIDEDEQVRADKDMVFYNAPTHPSGAVDLELGITNEALAVVTPTALPEEQQRIVFAAAIGGDQTFGDIGPVELTVRTGAGAVTIRATLDAGTTERSMLLASIYNRAGTWRFRTIGQGYDEGLLHLAVLHGVDVED